MSVIPSCFASENETYITVPICRRFLKDAGVNGTFNTREDYLQAIENYASRSEANKENTLSWLDTVLKEGITELHVSPVEFDFTAQEHINKKSWPSLIAEINKTITHPHICGQTYGKALKLVYCNYDENNSILSICASKYVTVSAAKNKLYTLIYPLFLDIYMKETIIVLRGKSKSTIYEYGSYPSMPVLLKLEKELSALLDFANTILGTAIKKVEGGSLEYKKNLYCLLETFTQTPKEIKELMVAKQIEIDQMINSLYANICGLTSAYFKDITWDIENLVEKYFSISYVDKCIFTTDREAYPLKLAATDEDESKVEQISGYDRPLQSTAVFFDNKRMLQKSKCCDILMFMWKRKDSSYFGPQFKVSFASKPKYFVIKFWDFTIEEDIQNVLFSLLNAK